MTTVTIIVDDNLVIVSGKAHTVNCSALSAATIHAVQWDGSAGWVEYALVNGTKTPNLAITDISPYQSYIDAWTAADNPPPPPPPTQAQLLQYAYVKQALIATGGFTVNANTSGDALNVSVSTIPAYANYLSSAAQLAQLMLANAIPTANFNWVQNSGNVSLTPQQVVNVGVAVGAMVQASFTVLGEVIAAINAGTITTTAQIDTPASPIPSWPTNS